MSDERHVPAVSSAALPAGSPASSAQTASAAPWAPAVSFEGISRSFSGVSVLKDITVHARAGHVLALLGENGAGKSTLMNILGGSVMPEEGRMRLAGQPYAPRTPQDARAAGIGFVHQELNLFPNLTVAENLHLQAFPRYAGLPWIDRRAMAAHARTLLARVGLDLAPDTALERLSAGERQLVEIAKALGANAHVLILDEPTTSLGARERDRLFVLMRELRAHGLTIIYISHDLADVMRECDDVVVLRDGVVVAQGEARQFSVGRIVALMIGREVTHMYPPRPPDTRGAMTNEEAAAAGEPRETRGIDSWHEAREGSAGSRIRNSGDAAPGRFELRGITEPGIVRDVSFTLYRGEILGVFGVMGAGRSELARILFGLDRASAGEVLLDGQVLTGGPRQRQRRGLAFVTEDRRQDGLCLDASIADNVMLTTLGNYCSAPLRLVQKGRVRAAVQRIRAAVRLSPAARATQAVRLLSGGNQQKVVLARWLLAEPRVLLLDEPTRGIDVGARADIYALIRDHAARGAAVLLISSELEELIGLSDRILVMRQGEISGEFRAGSADAVDRASILTAALPATSPTNGSDDDDRGGGSGDHDDRERDGNLTSGDTREREAQP